MKLKITDEFLWKLFSLSQKTKDILYFLGLSSFKEVFVPYSFSIRRIYEKRRAKTNFSKFIYRLKRNGYIKVKSLDPKGGFIITKKGFKKILKVALKKYQKKKRKDGKLIMVVFDIPERKRKLRDFLREILKSLGFVFFQKSIWISPFEVLEKTQLFVQKNDLEKYVKIFLIEKVEP